MESSRLPREDLMGTKGKRRPPGMRNLEKLSFFTEVFEQTDAFIFSVK